MVSRTAFSSTAESPFSLALGSKRNAFGFLTSEILLAAAFQNVERLSPVSVTIISESTSPVIPYSVCRNGPGKSSASSTSAEGSIPGSSNGLFGNGGNGGGAPNGGCTLVLWETSEVSKLGGAFGSNSLRSLFLFLRTWNARFRLRTASCSSSPTRTAAAAFVFIFLKASMSSGPELGSCDSVSSSGTSLTSANLFDMADLIGLFPLSSMANLNDECLRKLPADTCDAPDTGLVEGFDGLFVDVESEVFDRGRSSRMDPVSVTACKSGGLASMSAATAA